MIFKIFRIDSLLKKVVYQVCSCSCPDTEQPQPTISWLPQTERLTRLQEQILTQPRTDRGRHGGAITSSQVKTGHSVPELAETVLVYAPGPASEWEELSSLPTVHLTLDFLCQCLVVLCEEQSVKPRKSK